MPRACHARFFPYWCARVWRRSSWRCPARLRRRRGHSPRPRPPKLPTAPYPAPNGPYPGNSSAHLRASCAPRNRAAYPVATTAEGRRRERARAMRALPRAWLSPATPRMANGPPSAVRLPAPSTMLPPRQRQHKLPAPAPAATPATAATIAPMLAFRGPSGVRSKCKDVNRTIGVHRWKGRPTRISRRCSTTIFRCIARRRSGRIPPSPRRHLLRPQTPLRSLQPGLPTYKHG